jgi:hypothetical protein
MESGVTEPGLQAGSPPSYGLDLRRSITRGSGRAHSGHMRLRAAEGFYSMDCYRHLAEDRLAETLATEVIQASTDFDGTERAPMRLAEARITLGVVAARQGDREQAIHHGTHALGAPRKSLPSLLMVSRDLTRVLNDQYPDEPETQAYLDQLHALSSLTDSWSAQIR